MRFSLILLFTFISTFELFAQESPKKDTVLMQPLEIKAIRAGNEMGIAKTTLSATQIEKKNVGYDLPFIINQTPSIQVNSDAGNGVGYTGLRIRGTDATRINVTINGIPYNDAESQGTFLVNLPDISSSANSIQIQRGIGSSTNGAGAFGASININTNENNIEPSIELNNSLGSYYTLKNSLQVNSGLLKKHFILTGRLSSITSDGYVERAATNLKSFFTSAAFVTKNSSLRLNVFSGKEKTYAAWFGVNQTSLDTNRTYNPAGTEKSGSPYDNETDNYKQTHYQLFYNQNLATHLKLNVALFTTTGKGYFEQYKAGQSFSRYNLPNFINGNDTITNVNLVRQLWLDNIYYGSIFSIHYNKNKTSIISGGNISKYDGNHFGKIIYADILNAIPDNYKWYDLDAAKSEVSFYGKWTEQINSKWQTYVDLQARNIDYTINGFESNPSLIVKNNYFFFNPKAGISYINKGKKIYLSYSKAKKEPNRDDFETAVNESPKPETLHDIELGIEKRNQHSTWSVNGYFMYYNNQLVLTGEVNQVYAYTRKNIAKSYRAGIELEGFTTINKWLSLSGNLTLSTNKALDFNEFIDQYDNNYDYLGQKKIVYNKTDLAFSPAVISSGEIAIHPIANTEIKLMGKYVGKQFMDNTSNKERAIKGYYTQDVRIDYSLTKKHKCNVNFFLQGNNLFSTKYVANGYTFSYYTDANLTTENYYFPMATFNIIGGINVKL